MKPAVFVALVLIGVPGPASAISSKADCALWADRISGMVPVIRQLEESMAQMSYWQNIEGRGDLKTAVERADAARTAVIDPLKAYNVTLEDLTYQLQLCARGP